MLSTAHGTCRTQAITLASGNNWAIAGMRAHQARLVSKYLGGAIGVEVVEQPMQNALALDVVDEYANTHCVRSSR